MDVALQVFPSIGRSIGGRDQVGLVERLAVPGRRGDEIELRPELDEGIAADPRGVKLAGPSLAELAAPHLKDLDPGRVQVILRSLRQLEILQREGVSLTTPAYLWR